MSEPVWRPVRRIYCPKAGKMADLEIQLVYPAEVLPDSPPRVVAERCSIELECNRLEAPTCKWAGTLPDFDPFSV